MIQKKEPPPTLGLTIPLSLLNFHLSIFFETCGKHCYTVNKRITAHLPWNQVAK